MKWYQRLRYRLLGIQVLVVLLGMLMMVIAIPFITADSTIPRRSFLLVLGVAGISSLIAGAIASFVLWRTLVIPLRAMADNSQRIANGRYGERVPFPTQSGEAIQKLATNFNQMAQMLEAVEQQRVAMINNVSHELRTPLSGLQGMVEGMEDGVFAADSNTLNLMGREITRLSKLVDELQNLSRAEEGAIAFDIHDFPVVEVVNGVVLHLTTATAAKSITLTVDNPASPLIVRGDRDRTAQIVTNLVGNSIRYTPAGGQIVIVINSADTFATVAITDNGIGIDPADLPYLFERFYRVERSRSRQSGGSGIGLTIARHLAWAMEGDITAASDGHGRGSTFTIRLPLAPR